MKNFFEKINTFSGLRSSSLSGQVAVIMIVAIAIGLVLFAASINLTMVSQAKTYTMKAASSSATLMASTIASYGQKQYVETMGSRKEYCKTSHGGLIALIVLIVLIVIAVYTGYVDTTALGAYTGAVSTGATIAAVMQGASILIAANTDPGISAAWNKMQEANLSTTGQFVERGVLLALQGAATDAVKIPDLYDEDHDGVYGFEGNDPTQPAKDHVSRMAHYITKRYLELQGPDTTATRAFLDALHQLVIVPGGDNFALLDPIYYPDEKTKNNQGAAHVANHLCYQPYFNVGTFDLNPLYNQRPAECDPCCIQTEEVMTECTSEAGNEQIGNRTTCPMRSPFRDPGNIYQYVYDISYEDSTNNFMSLREQLGRDDEHRDYHTAQLTPNWHADPFAEPQSLSVASGFALKDVVGYYTASGYPANTDKWVSPNPLPIGTVPTTPRLFPFLYKMHDWGPDLSQVTYNNYECFWCDANQPVGQPGNLCPVDLSAEVSRLVLPVNPATAPYNNTQGWCVNKTNKGGAGDPPVVSDNVRSINDLFAADTDCALPPQTPVPDLTKYISKWKAGADRYCSNKADTSYDLYCIGKNDPANPEAVCTLDNRKWPDDMIDEITYGEMPMLFDLERTLWNAGRSTQGLKQLAKEIDTWYGQVETGGIRAGGGIADWIEPPCLDQDNCPGSFTKLQRPGRLHVWRAQFIEMRRVIMNWYLPPGDAANPKYVSPSCTGPGASWCVQSTPCPGMPAAEEATFDFNANGQRGDVADVIACLKWNATDAFTYSDGTTAVGNEAKFRKCATNCSAANCSNLPRSLVPNFYTFLPLEFYPGDETKFNDCLNTGLIAGSTIETCAAKCNNTVLPSGAPYPSLFFDEPESDRLDDISDWCNNVVTSGDPLLNACNGAKMTGGVTTLTCATNQTECRCSWADSCSFAKECGGITASSCGAGSFCDSVTLARPISRGTCGNARAAEFILTLNQSADEARIQVEKFKQRFKFLEGRYAEAQSIVATLTQAIDALTVFLDNGTPNDLTDSPAENFIQVRLAPLQNTTKDLPAFAIYVWQDKDPTSLNPAGQPRWGTGQGYWHAVKADVRLPRRCTGSCIAADWPKIDSKTSGGFLSKKVCYKLVNLEGMTKARVIRYDQDKDTTGLLFPGGGQIWRPRLSNPTLSTEPDPTGIRTTCADLIDPDLAGWLAGTTEQKHLGAAFMLNQIPDLSKIGQPTPEGKYADCWNKIHYDLLSHGIMSESCAQYYFVDGAGFRVKFVPCDDW